MVHLNQDIFKQDENLLLASWHNNVYFGTPFFGSLQAATLASLSKDGDFIARFCDVFQMRAFRGSSSRGGSKAIRDILRAYKTDSVRLVLTVDGPRGPLYEVQHGIGFLAYQLQLPVIPWDFEAVPKWEAKSWDKHKVPMPFCLFVSRFAPPVSPPQNKEELEVYPELLKSRMMENKQEIAKYLRILQSQGFDKFPKKLLTKMGFYQLPEPF